MTNGQLLERVRKHLGLPTQDGEIQGVFGQDLQRPHFFLAKLGEKVFEIQCLEVDSGGWLEDLNVEVPCELHVCDGCQSLTVVEE
tara:strand:- start:6173 stop:6427 length:255 start_codon:yes stop_codon:yes gene_type:complete